MNLKNTTLPTNKTYSSRVPIHERVRIILEFCENGQELTR